MKTCTWKDARPDDAQCANCGRIFESTEDFEAHFERQRITLHAPDGSEVTLEAWEEHGAWYELGHADEVGALYAPMMSDGTLPTDDDLCTIEVRYDNA